MGNVIERLLFIEEELVALRNDMESNGISDTSPMWKQLDTIISKLDIYAGKYRDKLAKIPM